MKELITQVAGIKKGKQAQLATIQQLGRQIPAAPDDLLEPKLSDNAWYIGRTRYARRDANGEPTEAARELFWRVAYNIAAADRLYGHDADAHLNTAAKFYRMM